MPNPEPNPCLQVASTECGLSYLQSPCDKLSGWALFAALPAILFFFFFGFIFAAEWWVSGNH